VHSDFDHGGLSLSILFQKSNSADECLNIEARRKFTCKCLRLPVIIQGGIWLIDLFEAYRKVVGIIRVYRRFVTLACK